jgi:hypothetical protein
LAAALVLVLVRDRPEDLGQHIDGVRHDGHPAGARPPASKGAYKSLQSWSVADAARTPTLWLIVLTFGFSDYVFLGTLSHQVTYLTGEVE